MGAQFTSLPHEMTPQHTSDMLPWRLVRGGTNFLRLQCLKLPLDFIQFSLIFCNLLLVCLWPFGHQ